MLINRLSLLALAFAGTNAALLSKRQYSDVDEHLNNVCQPIDESGVRDFSAPCNAMYSIQYECTFGPAGGAMIRGPPHGDDDDDVEPGMQPNATQRVCFCQSQIRDMMDGCMKCIKAHGGVEGEDWFSASLIDPAMDTYCNASNEATVAFNDFIFESVEGGEESATEVSEANPTTYTDSVGNATDVSLYFTPSVTGSAAYIPAMPTPESSGGNVTYITSHTSNGEIVPTAVGDERETGSGSAQSGSAQSGGAKSGSATTASDAGAMQTAMAQSVAFGALGLAALVAAL